METYKKIIISSVFILFVLFLGVETNNTYISGKAWANAPIPVIMKEDYNINTATYTLSPETITMVKDIYSIPHYLYIQKTNSTTAKILHFVDSSNYAMYLKINDTLKFSYGCGFNCYRFYLFGPSERFPIDYTETWTYRVISISDTTLVLIRDQRIVDDWYGGSWFGAGF
jgi:hypothetical protein